MVASTTHVHVGLVEPMTKATCVSVLGVLFVYLPGERHDAILQRVHSFGGEARGMLGVDTASGSSVIIVIRWDNPRAGRSES